MKLGYVGSAPFFSTLSEEGQERISERLHLEHRHSGEVLFDKGDESLALYLIKSGWIRLVADGGTVLASQGPGSLVGETDMFLERIRSLTAIIATDAELWVLTQEDLAQVIAEYPPVGLGLALAFGSRLPLVDHYLVDHRLKSVPFLSGLDDRVLESLASQLVAVEKKDGEYIVEAGQPPEAFYIIETGLVHLQGSEEGGDFSELGTGETFGEMALLTGRPHARSARAATDTTLWALPAGEFEALTEQRPDVRLALSKNIREPLLAEDKMRAGERLTAMPLFSGLSEEVMWAVAERFLLCHVPAGETVFEEGTPGDALYVVDSGQVEIISQAAPGGTILARLGTEEFFGEMALLTGKPRSTAARAATHTNLWVLYRSDFEDLVNRHPAISLALSKVLSERLSDMDRRFTESHLRGLKLLSGLSSGQLEEVGRRLKPVRFRASEVILREGRPGDEMYFVESGQVRVQRGSGPQGRVLADLGSGDLFGEMALLTGNPRCATITALSDVELWSVGQSDFDYLVTTYPNLALALSRLLSERLSATDERYLDEPVAPQAAVARAPVIPVPVPLPRPAPVTKPPAPVKAPPKPKAKPKPAAKPRAKPAPKAVPRRKRAPVRRRPASRLVNELNRGFQNSVSWFGALSGGARIRLVLFAMLVVWLTCIAVPALLISTLSAANVTNLNGAIAFAQLSTPTAAGVPESIATPLPAAAGFVQGSQAQTQARVLGAAIPDAEPTQPPAQAAVAVEAVPVAPPPAAQVEAAAPPPEEPALAPVPSVEPTETPWIIVVTSTPPPPTETPIPPTAVPKPKKASAASAALKAPPTATTSPRKVHPPRELDPRLAALNVHVVEPEGLRPGQKYWRLMSCRWQNKEESGNDHTLYVEVLDENGSRIVGTPVEIRWGSGNLTVFVEDKPPPVFGANFPMYGTLGSYSVNIPGLPSDTVVGMGMGTPEQPAYTIHTNFFLTFKRVVY